MTKRPFLAKTIGAKGQLELVYSDVQGLINMQTCGDY